MAALARHRPTPVATYTPVSLSSKYQYRRMKDMLRSALGNPPGTALLSFDQNSMRGIALSGLNIPGSASTEGFPSAGLGGFALGSVDPGSRRGSVLQGRMGAPGGMPGQQSRKGSVTGAVGAS